MPITEVGGHRLKITNLDKVLYPATGFTKGEALRYYADVSDVLLPHVRDRPASFLRFPDGVDGERFFHKNAPSHAPDWVSTAAITGSGKTVRHILLQDLATLLWAANLAGLEMHVPQYKVNGPEGSDRIVIDLDPGEPASIVECCRAALLLRDALADDGLESWAKTSGSKGLHLYVPIKPAPADRTTAYAKSLAQRLEHEHPDLVVHRMRKDLRPGKIFLDWSQNSVSKTTIAPYSLRARSTPTVSTPVTWDEVESCTDPEQLVFHADDIPARLDEYGDLLAPMLRRGRRLPAAGPG